MPEITTQPIVTYSNNDGYIQGIIDAMAEVGIIQHGQTIRGDQIENVIKAVQLGTNTTDATAAAGDILSGKTAYVKGQKITGNIASKGAADLTASGPTVTAPAGYYPSGASKSVETVSHPAPTQALTLGTYATIRASHAQGAGYVNAGTTTHDYNVSRHAGGTYTPGSSSQLLLNAGMWYLNNALYMGAVPSASVYEGTLIPSFSGNNVTFNLTLSGKNMIALFPNNTVPLPNGPVVTGFVGCSSGRSMNLDLTNSGYYGVGGNCTWTASGVTFTFTSGYNVSSNAWRYLLI